MGLRRYWIRFGELKEHHRRIFSVFGCGVTASDLEEALDLIRAQLFSGEELPPIKEVIEDIDVSTLDKNHVLPNMGSPASFGIWFPQGYQFRGR